MQLIMPGNKLMDMKHQIDIAEHRLPILQPVRIPLDAPQAADHHRMAQPDDDQGQAARSLSFKGVLTHETRNDVIYGAAAYHPMSSEFRAASEQAKQHKPTCNEVHASALGPKFFEMSPRHAKAYVMVDDNIKAGDTVGFRYNETDYKAFVREVDPAPAPDGGLAWWVTAFVQVEGLVSETILVTSSRKVA